jgi:serine/threonine-protein kinase
MATCPTCKNNFPDTMRLCPTDGTVLEGTQAPKDDAIGRTLDGKYRLDRKINSGGMGTVYKATHLMLGKSVAVKLIKADLPSSPDVVRRFQREAKAASELNHPNIAPAYDLGQTQDGTLYIAMEYVDGRSLKDVIQGGPLDPARIIRISKQIASALALAHRHEIIHRDLKPQNIMITKDAEGREVAKLLDFGIAKTLDEGATQLTATGFSLGTPQYMSPEQAYGRQVDGRSDLYSLGIIVYEMLIGEVPFSDPSTPAVLVKQMTEAPVPPELKRPDLHVSPELAAIALKCLEKDPAKRYQTADEFSAALDMAAAAIGAPVGTLPSSAPSATTGAAASTVVIGAKHSGDTTQPASPGAAAITPIGDKTTLLSNAPAAPAFAATTKMNTPTPLAVPAAAPVAPAPVVAAAPAPVPAASPAPKVTPPAPSPSASGGGSRVAVAAVVAVLLLGGGAYAAYSMGLLKLGGASSTTTSTTQLASSGAPGAAAPAAASATPDTSAAPASTTPPAGDASSGSASSGNSGSTPPSGGASSAAPPAPPSAPPAAAPPSAVTPPPTGASGNAKATSTKTAAAPPAAAPTTAKPGASVNSASVGGAVVSSTPTKSPSQAPAATSAPAPAPAPAALPANPSVAFRCDGPPDICSVLRSEMDQAISKDSMSSIRDAARADVALVGTVTFVDEQTQRMFGTSFTIRNYTIDVSGEARRSSESVPMPSPATLNYDARYRDRLDEKARLVAASVVEKIREFWKKK